MRAGGHSVQRKMKCTEVSVGVEARQWAQQESGPLTERIPGSFAVRSVSNTDVAQD